MYRQVNYEYVTETEPVPHYVTHTVTETYPEYKYVTHTNTEHQYVTVTKVSARRNATENQGGGENRTHDLRVKRVVWIIT